MEQAWCDTLSKLMSLTKIDETTVEFPEKLDLVSIIESLQPFMTHSDPAIRGKAANIFKVLINEKFSNFDAASLSLVKNFVIQKIDDPATVIESLSILSLYKRNNSLTSSETISICIRALKGIKTFRFGVENRHEIFKFVQSSLIDSIFQGSENEIVFLETFLTSIESEKDPRILKIIFDSILSISKQRDSGLKEDYIEEFFEAVFCYFPVTFRSNPSDPNLISVEELKASLRRVISGISQFGDLAVPVLIEKLSLNSNAAKVDSLDVLVDAVDCYDVKSFSQFRYQLEIVLFSEITGNPDTKVQSKSLQLVRSLSHRLSGTEEGQNWMSKFLKEALMAVKLESTAILSKSALLIDAVSGSCEEAFKFSIEFCLDELLQISSNSRMNVKEQSARNCLVALLSPVKMNPQWIDNDNVKSHSTQLEAFFDDCCEDSFTIYLVIFSFVSSILSKSCCDVFIKRFIDSCRDSVIPIELKNCIWLASKSYPEGFGPFIESLSNPQMLCALSSTPTLARNSLKRLIDLNLLSACDEVISKSSDLSSIVQNDYLLVSQLISSSLDSISIIKLISNCSEALQVTFIEKKLKLSQVIIGARPNALRVCHEIILNEFEGLESPSLISLFNKCPDLWLPRISNLSPEKYLYALKGLIYRMEPAALDLLKSKFDHFPSACFAKVFKNNSEMISKETFHVCRTLYIQWLLNFLIPMNCESVNSLTFFIAVLSHAPSSLIESYAKDLPNLIFNFLKISAQNESEIKVEAWKLLLSLLEKAELNIEELLDFALGHISLKLESSSEIRYLALKLLSMMIENSSYRPRCTDEMQKRVLFALKAGPIDDPKRAVRQEAAKARNLWFILKEGILNE